MPDPLVSILLPVHNGAAYLQEAIASVLRQTHRDFELIVIDDASTDESPEIAKSFGDPRLRLIRSSERLRICRGLNLGIDNSRGHFLARMDADDICQPRRLERQLQFLDRHPNIGFCGSWVRRFGEQQVPRTYHRPIGPARLRAFAVFDNPLVHSTVMIRRNTLSRLEVAYRPDFADAEDYDLWSRLFEITQGDNLPEILLDYRVHLQSVTLQKADAMDWTAGRVLKRELKRLGFEPTDSEVKQHRLWSTNRLKHEAMSADIDSAEQWFIRLVKANRISQTHDPTAFLWATRQIWFALCYQAIVAEQPIMKRFFRSPLSRNDLKNAMILLGAFVKHRL